MKTWKKIGFLIIIFLHSSFEMRPKLRNLSSNLCNVQFHWNRRKDILDILEGIFYCKHIFRVFATSHHSKFWNKMYPFARGSRVEASTIGIISIGWVDFTLILVSRAPTYCNHADILCSCNARSSPSISLLVLHFPPTHPHPLSVSFFAFVHFPRPLSPARSMLSYPTDNSIILHAKTASDVLAQSASHLCEQITSYRKTDFIFEKERWSWFFFSVLLDPPPRFIFLSLLLSLFFLLIFLYTGYIVEDKD